MSTRTSVTFLFCHEIILNISRINYINYLPKCQHLTCKRQYLIIYVNNT